MPKPAYRWPWPKVRRQVLIRDGYRCRIQDPTCCIGTADEVDHIVPPAEGGARLDLRNLRAACQPCNASRGGRRAHEVLRARNTAPPSRVW